MTPRDIAALLARAYTHMHPWSFSVLEETLAQPSTRLFAARNSVLIARFVLDEGEILALATDPSAQRTGAASALMADLHAAARTAGVARIFLEVSAENEPARAFYARHGYEQVGRRKGYYARPQGGRADALVLVRSDAATESGKAPSPDRRA